MDVLLTTLLGLLVSFLGQLPLGNLSITATQIGLEEGINRAWMYSIGIAIVEMIYLRVALSGMNWVIAHHTFFTIINKRFEISNFFRFTNKHIHQAQSYHRFAAVRFRSSNVNCIGHICMEY